MKIVDFKTYGNVIKLYFGEDSFHDYWGDDWNDVPYEHNAGRVYDDFISGTVEFAFNSNFSVLEACDDYRNMGNSSYCKDDFKDRKVPCIVIVKKTDKYTDYTHCFESFIKPNGFNADEVFKIYFNDNLDKLKENIVKFGAVIIKKD